MPSFGTASLKQLSTCDERLQHVFTKVIGHWDCAVMEGKRSEAQQQFNVLHGVSKTLDSKHVYPLGAPSLAADVSPFPIKWGDKERFYAFAGFVIGVAYSMGLQLRWGGDWDSDREFHDQSFYDLPHFELKERP